MAFDDRGGDVAELSAARLGMGAKALEGGVGRDRVACHEDALRLLDHGTAAERALQALILREPLQGDVDRALELLGRAVDDVREHAALRGL